MAAWASGLLRIRKPTAGAAPTIERFAYESKIGGSPRSLFEDTDGNIWIGMRGGGLLRVSESVLQNDIPLDGLTTDGVRGLSAAGDGSVWVATEHSLHRFSGTRREGLQPPQTLALHTDQSGTLWAATTQGRDAASSAIVCSRSRCRRVAGIGSRRSRPTRRRALALP